MKSIPLKSVQLADGRKMSFLHHVCEKENAPTIVFAHGFPLDHSMWLGQLPLVEYASLLMPDLPGFGQSEPAVGDVSMQSMSDDVAGLLEQLQIPKVIFCGLSMGGYIGWRFVADHGEMLAGLICCNTRAEADDETTARARGVAAAQVLKTGAEPVAETMRQKLFSESTLKEQPQVVDAVVGIIVNTSVATIAATQRAMSRRPDSSSLLSGIDVPTLVIAGTEDLITPARGMEDMALQIPESTLVTIKDAGHLSPMESPEVFNLSLSHWLAGLFR